MTEQPSSTPESEDKSSNILFSDIVKSKEFIVTITSIVTSTLLFYKQLQDQPIKDINIYSLVIEILNIIVLIIGLVIFSRRYKFELPGGGKLITLIDQEVSHRLKPKADKEIEDRIKKRVIEVSKIVYQLLNTFKGFAVCLILLYAFLFIADFNKKRDINDRQALKKELENKRHILDSTRNAGLPFMLKVDSGKVGDSSRYYIISKASFDNDTNYSNLKKYYKSALDSIANINDTTIEKTYRSYTSLLKLIMSKDPSNEIVVNEIIVAIVDNFFNVLSTAFLLMAFYILYHQAVEAVKDDGENFQPFNNYWTPVLIAVIIILLSTLIVFTGFCKQNLQSLVVWMRITGGIFNGVGMLLLVSRFISMEYLYKQSNDAARNFYLIGTIIILPVYVVVQPLWGIFQVNIENKEVLKEIILMLCLWGKIFFIMIIYYMLDNKWLHTYIYMMPVAEERIKLVTETFDDTIVKSIQKTKKPDVKK